MSPPPRRILMTTDAVGGVWVYAAALAQALVRRGCAIRLVTLGPAPTPDQLAAFDDCPGLEVEVTDLALEWMDPDGRDFSRARRALAAVARDHRPDVVHLNGFREALADWNAPVLVVAHSCVRSWWRACRGTEPDTAAWRRYRDNVARGLAAAQHWIAPSVAFRDSIEALYAPPSRGGVIHNGIAPAGTQPRAKQPFVLGAGRFWDEAKNLAALAEVAPRLSWPVTVAGPLTADGAAVAPPAVPNLTFAGALPHRDLLALMRQAAVFASPALYEPFGLGVLEAARAGCALVLSDIPTFRELWNGAALFVSPRDPDALLFALERVCRDDALRAALAQRAAARARRYSIERTAQKYVAAYATMLAGAVTPIRPRPLQQAEAAR
jgi:glycosyltransferase involved in cell wall biosynthesis